jgi:lysine decarboxylase
MDQNKTPYLDALKKYLDSNVVPFDVPGHHMGNVQNDFMDIVGKKAYQADVNAPRGLDNLNHPNGVIKEAQALMADAYNADEAFFLINGTSSGIIAMIMAACKANDEIILPRNCHKSVINALVLSGATPIFIMPEIDMDLEIANQPSIEEYKKAIDENPKAKAIFVINPTYFGAVIDLKTLTDYAHQHNMLVLVDEAHGAHFGFDSKGPLSAMNCGADMSAASIHKTSGALTQASVLLKKGDRIKHFEIFKILSMLNTTSPSTLLIASLDSARHLMALKGDSMMQECKKLADYAREEINKIKGFKAAGVSHFKEHLQFDFDRTKLVIELDDLTINGFKLYQILKDEYEIQMELAETYAILAIISVASKKEHIDRLVSALKKISQKYYLKGVNYPKFHYSQNFPMQEERPREAFQAPLKIMDLDDCVGEVSKEMIMVYPPGIPLIIPGEIFTKSIVDRIKAYKKANAVILSDFDDGRVSCVDSFKAMKGGVL